MRLMHLKTAALISVIALFLLPQFTPYASEGDTVFEVMAEGETLGRLRSPQQAYRLLQEARRNVARREEEILLVEPQLVIEGRRDTFAHFTGEEEMLANMESMLEKNRIASDIPAYSIKVGQMMVNVRSLDSVRHILQNALNVYQEKESFLVDLVPDTQRRINVMTARAVSEGEIRKDELMPRDAGAGDKIDPEDTENATAGTGFESFDYGLKEMSFGDKVEVTESYLSDEQLTGEDEALGLLTELQAEQKIYKVQPGDTLSEIAIDTETPLDVLIALNDTLEDENSTIRADQELIITSPVPALSIERKEELYYEEDYEAEIEYIYNDDWYTTDKEVRQNPSAGHRKVAAIKTYRNDKETDTQILMEEVTYQAVPKVVEVGTKVPPTFIKPISGGRISSGFGRRSAPKRGASTYHKGIDWATPVGTAVVASSGGVVERAGWGSGYGYVVYINHADGRQTRYGHLSKILVKPGDRVSQGQKIALSGNTGRSTGPHIHFEILVGGTAVNPLDIIN